MRSPIILCILASIGLTARGQLNFKGNPLTENIDYTAEETHLSERNARRSYEPFGIPEGRRVAGSNDRSAPSPSDDVADQDEQAFRISCKTKEGTQPEDGTKRLSMDDEEASGIWSSFATHGKIEPAGSMPGDPGTPQVSIRSSPKASISQPSPESLADARQLREYPVQAQLPHRPASSQGSHQTDGQSQPYRGLDQSPLHSRNLQSHSTTKPSSISIASGQALDEFLKSRTPDESQMALQHYFRIREYAARGATPSGEVNHVQGDRSSAEEIAIQSDPVSNQILQQEMIDFQSPLSSALPSTVLRDGTGLISYSPAHRGPQSWNQVGLQSRQDSFVPGPGRLPPPLYRAQVAAMAGRLRDKPWSQPRIGSGPPFHRPRGTIFAGPPAPPPSSMGKWKPPVQMIYTRPPGFGHGPPSNLVPSEDASHWFPEADGDQPPPRKDLLYSQLYAQSYDPRYYGYIAKTGKIKPWLYGKLGEPKEKSIWWELFSGFKRHGMKNIMNPMFLLGMTIPTLTLMLTALVQKKSLGRSFSGDRLTGELVEEYARRVREAVECYEKRVRDSESGEENKCW